MISLLFSKAAIGAQYETNMALYPIAKGEVDGFLQGKPEDFGLYLRYLYGHMAAQDVLSAEIGVIAGFAKATLEAAEKIAYMKTIPAEIFFPYVLYHRVNSECLEDCRGYLLRQLLPLVAGKSMEQAALAVNYWCYAHATYTPADDRTLGPLSALRRTRGRCGEESVLAVAALRSVGIPARQVYCPRWAHCDDNHAWVEVWIDGNWHYLGACEPEPVLDRGWFTAAASRAMLVDTKCFYGENLYEMVNSTHRYTNLRHLTVHVLDGGKPAPGAAVEFQIVNYSEAFTLLETLTDETGCAGFDTAAGDLLVFAQRGEKKALRKVDVRQETEVSLELQEDFPAYLAFDLMPPADTSGEAPHETNAEHERRLRLCEAHLAGKRANFKTNTPYLSMAAGNWQEIQNFLEDIRYALPIKAQLLTTLRPKDFVDITKETLLDALETAQPGQYPEEIFVNYILAPRIADEMLLPQRQQVRALFPHGFADPQEILTWMGEHMEILPDQGVSNYFPSAYGCLRCRQVPVFAFDMVFVALCRAFSLPARLEPATGQAQWWEHGVWHPIRDEKPPVRLTLTIPAGKNANYFEHLTLGYWDKQDYVTLKHPDLTLEEHYTFILQPGRYRLTATTRQIDGTASVAMRHIDLREDTTLTMNLPEDQTQQRLKKISLSLPDGPVKQRCKAATNRLLIFADPGSEPTEHLLREMLEIAADFRALNCHTLLVTANPAHPTVALLKAALPEVEILPETDPATLSALHLQMGVGDLRLPFVVCMDAAGNGVWADANYRIRLAQTLADVQKLLR